MLGKWIDALRSLLFNQDISMNDYRIGPMTDRLLLRAMTVDDAEAFFAFNGNPEVMRLTGEPQTESLEEATEALAQYPDFETIGYGRWGCVLKGEQRLIGFCGLKYLDDLEEVDLGYRFLPEYWGRGLATEACRASLQFGFDELKLHRIIAMVLRENAGSIRVLEKVGMRLDGKVEYEGERALLYAIESA